MVPQKVRVARQIAGGFARCDIGYNRDEVKLESHSTLNLLRSMRDLESVGFEIRIQETPLGWIGFAK